MGHIQDALGEQLLVVEQRLAETLRVYAAYSTINRQGNKEINPALNALMNLRGGFWNAAVTAFQAHLFISMYALVELKPKVSTLATIGQRMHAEGKSEKIGAIIKELDCIRTRYVRFRHNLFGHNGSTRDSLVNEFDKYGFTWEMVEQDLATLEHAFKVFWLLVENKPLLSRDETKRMRFPYISIVNGTANDTAGLLNDMQIGLQA
jgi:hypothetical protein